MVNDTAVLEERVITPSHGTNYFYSRIRAVLDYIVLLKRKPTNETNTTLATLGNMSSGDRALSQTSSYVVELQPQISPELQAILDDPAWDQPTTTNRREILIIGYLGRLGYLSISSMHNPKGRHLFMKDQKLVASLGLGNNTYVPLNGSIPDDMQMVLNRADFKPEIQIFSNAKKPRYSS